MSSPGEDVCAFSTSLPSSLVPGRQASKHPVPLVFVGLDNLGNTFDRISFLLPLRPPASLPSFALIVMLLGQNSHLFSPSLMWFPWN